MDELVEIFESVARHWACEYSGLYLAAARRDEGYEVRFVCPDGREVRATEWTWGPDLTTAARNARETIKVGRIVDEAGQAVGHGPTS